MRINIFRNSRTLVKSLRDRMKCTSGDKVFYPFSSIFTHLLRFTAYCLCLLLFAAMTGCEQGENSDENGSGGTKSAVCDIIAFTVSGTAWNINGTAITHTYPTETDETQQMTPAITVSAGATVSPASGVAQNFFTGEGVAYTVTAEDGKTTKTYTAKALIQSPVIVESGTTGDCNWTITGTSPNYTLTISGTGAMENYISSGYCPWVNYWNNIKILVIQEGVTTIGNYAFAGFIRLTAVTIGNSVTSIGDWAFVGCTSLPTVTMGNSVTSIGNGAFYYCTGLTTVTIGNAVETIDEYAFAGCTSLTSVTIGDAAATIGEYAFYNCTGLTEVTIGNSVTSIGNGAFYYCTSLASVIIGNSVTTIGSSAFSGCSGLTTVTNMRTTPQSINSGVFYNVSLITCTLRVPASAVNTYKDAEGWKDFKNIVGI